MIANIPVLVLVLLVDAAHQCSSRRQNFVDEYEDSLLGRELDSLANNIDELPNGEVGGNKVLFLVYGRNVALLDLFADDLCKTEC